MRTAQAPCPLGPRSARGVHLTELLVVITVLAVLLAASGRRCSPCCCGNAPMHCN